MPVSEPSHADRLKAETDGASGNSPGKPPEKVSVRLAAELDEGAEEHAYRREQQPRAALEHFNDAPN